MIEKALELPTETDPVLSILALQAIEIDHVAFAVKNLQESIDFFSKFLGFRVEETRETKGAHSGMISAVLNAGKLSFVLVQGTTPESQVSRFIETFSCGVHHVACRVNNLEAVVRDLKNRGIEFATSEIYSADMVQIFTRRDPKTGLMIELIQRGEFQGFTDNGVNQIFEDLEKSDFV